MKTIGILGGTFDPIHNGHLQIAGQVLSKLELDEMHFLPCSVPVHRDPPLAGGAIRQKMIELAIADCAGFKLNTAELDRGGQSYMIDTLRQLREHHPSESIFLVLGVDAFSVFHHWKSPDAILSLVNLVICRRPGFDLDWSSYSECQIESLQNFRQMTNGGILELDIDETPCSSSQIKQQLRSSCPDQATNCLPETVLGYIASNHLYE